MFHVKLHRKLRKDNEFRPLENPEKRVFSINKCSWKPPPGMNHGFNYLCHKDYENRTFSLNISEIYLVG
jgi:hypothetical protein